MKKTIAFSWINPLEASAGGIERVTRRLMDGLSRRGHECLYILHDVEAGRFLYEGADVGDLRTFLEMHAVDVFVNQNGYSSGMSEALRGSGWRGRYIVCHHNEPRYLQKLYDLRRVVAEIRSPAVGPEARLAWILRLLCYPLWREWSSRKIGKTQDLNYQLCDRYVVLSPSFLPQFSLLIGRRLAPKAIAIPNPLSFEIEPEQARTFTKAPVALIVARLNDAEKRISHALRAWQAIEVADLAGWELKIVGDGPDAAALRRKAATLGLKRVDFVGRQESLPYYQSASIFMMTSRVEGWGLTLTEAMQTGAVPVAFDAYASLRDIVEDGVTGIIVPDGDNVAFAGALKRLMENPGLRNSLSGNGIAACQRYRMDAVLDAWEAVL